MVLIPNPGISENQPNVHLPLGVISLATALRMEDIDAHILDINAMASDVSFSDVPDMILAKNPDVIGFSTVCTFYPITLRIARRCKEQKKEVKIILGGPQASVCDMTTMDKFHFVDIILRGEADRTIVPLIRALEGKGQLFDVPGITFRSGSEIVRTSLALPVEDLDTLPEPKYDLYPSMDLLDVIFIEDGRGCPFNCSFCSTSGFWSRKFRMHSPERIISLLKDLAAKYGRDKKYNFTHDLSTYSKDRLVRLCQGFIDSGVNVGWGCFSRVDVLDEEAIDMMARAGCDSVFFGIESGSARMQKSIGKNLDLSHIFTTVDQMIENGISYTASFVVGFPDETVKDLRATLRLAMDLRYRKGGCHEIQFHKLYPLMGSRLFQEYGDKLQYDGNFQGFAHGQLENEDLETIKKNPELFSTYYYYPTEHYSRNFLLRVHYIMLNMLYMPYTQFFLLKEKQLDYPDCVIEKASLLDLPDDTLIEYGTYPALATLFYFVTALLIHSGLEGHPALEIMKYELAAAKVRTSKENVPMVFEEFAYNVEGFVDQLENGGFQESVMLDPMEKHIILFTRKDDNIVTVKCNQSTMENLRCLVMR